MDHLHFKRYSQQYHQIEENEKVEFGLLEMMDQMGIDFTTIKSLKQIARETEFKVEKNC